ncbi:MAG: CopD family protein [Ekhidna sp.]|nr:CopD family protein [Ekhidna sp.]MBC6410865.1 CopD family protein [Ekhidna sp.]MBC6426162.1 CopD family protein [Ekhidna sp.]
MSYLYLKALHIIFMTTWFAGLFYIVRLFIYHSEALEKEEPDRSILSRQLAFMSKKLWFIITWPSAILNLIFGLSLLIVRPGWLQQPFMYIKLGFVFLLFLYHFACHGIYLQLQKGIAKYSSTQLRVFNEIATIILFAVVFLIVLKNQLSWVWGTLGLISFVVILMVAIKLYKRLRERE